MDLAVQLDIVTPNAEFRKMIIDAIRDEVSRLISHKNLQAEHDIRNAILVAIQRSAEFQSMGEYAGGALGAEFGFIAPHAIQSRLISVIDSAIKISINTNLKTTSKILNLDIDMNAIINSSIGTYVSNGNNVDWLKWLLTEGTSPVVQGYHIEYNLDASQMARSRTHTALMELGGSWSVPHSFAGDASDNFISRAIQNDAMPEIEKIIRDLIA